MCGRIVQRTPPAQMVDIYRAALETKAGEGAAGERRAGQGVLAVGEGAGARRGICATWGLPAPWDGRKLLRHARAETALEKDVFARAARARRCIVPADAWYEWGTAPGAARGAHELTRADGALAALAALWWPDDPARARRRIVIVTKEAEDTAAAVHHRTPMMVTRETTDLWLSRASTREAVAALLARPAGEEGALNARRTG